MTVNVDQAPGAGAHAGARGGRDRGARVAHVGLLSWPFHSRLLVSHSPLLVDVARADAALAAEGSGNCWSAEFGRALEPIACKAGEGDLGRGWCDSVFAGHSVFAGTVMRTLEQAHESEAWGGFVQVAILREHLRAQQESSSKHLTYFSWFKLSEPGWPPYLRGLQHDCVHGMMKQLASFRLGAHALRVEAGRRQGELWEARTCQRCPPVHLQSLSCQDDEHHCSCYCAAFGHLRVSVPGAQHLIASAAGCVRSFMSGDA